MMLEGITSFSYTDISTTSYNYTTLRLKCNAYTTVTTIVYADSIALLNVI